MLVYTLDNPTRLQTLDAATFVQEDSPNALEHWGPGQLSRGCLPSVYSGGQWHASQELRGTRLGRPRRQDAAGEGVKFQVHTCITMSFLRYVNVY